MGKQTMPARLKYATSQDFGVSGMTWSYLHARVKVKNLAYVKDVAIHYRSSGSTWDSAPLPWISNHGDYDLFGTNNAPNCSEFVVRYIANGTAYWDNNGGLNYRLRNFTNIVGGNVALNKATAQMQTQGGNMGLLCQIRGEIYVNNLSYHKSVGVMFTADGGLSWSSQSATYAGTIGEGTYTTSSGAERWIFSTPLLSFDPRADVFKLAAYYEDLQSGMRYWDRNFDQDFTLSKANGSTIE